MNCGQCKYWKKTMDGYMRWDRFGDPAGERPATGLCQYKLPIWVRHPSTSELDGDGCATFEQREDK